MPTFTGNLKDLGLDPRPGLQPYLKFTLQRAGVSGSGTIYAATTTVEPNGSGAFSVDLVSTLNIVPNSLVKLTGGWLGEDDFFELPPFQVPEQDGTLADLMALAELPVTGVWGFGFGPPPVWFNGFIWFDISTNPVMGYPREF